MKSDAFFSGFADEMDKVAVGPGTIAAVHLGANTAFKGFSESKRGHRAEANQFASGLRHGTQGRELTPIVRNVARFGVGPESTVGYDLGQLLAEETKDMSPRQRQKFLKKIRKSMAMTEHLKEAPVARTLVPGINRYLKDPDKAPSKFWSVVKGKKRPLQHGASAALGVMGGMVNPEIAIHMGLNAARYGTAKSKAGKKFFRNQAAEGLAEGASEGAKGKLKGLGQDLALSPGSRYSRRLGEALHKELQSNPKGATRAMKSLGGAFSETGSGKKLIDRGVAAAKRLL